MSIPVNVPLIAMMLVVSLALMLIAIRRLAGSCWPTACRNVARQPAGGFRCSDCGMVGGDLSYFGHDGYVSPMRTMFSRENGGTTSRTSSWNPGTRGW